MNLPDDLRPVLRALRREGRPLLVGGCVRDWLLGRPPKDFDVEVFGLDWDRLLAALRPWGPTDVVGRAFGVVKLRLGSGAYDFALPRRERKSGRGHRGFVVEADATLDAAAAAARRDFTVNALFYDPFEDRVLDFHRGREDLEARILRHTSAAFGEDPLRALRAFQLAARFEMAVAPETAALCAAMVEAYGELPRERVWAEWDKFATRSERPSLGLEALRRTGWLRHFPELAALDGLPQEPAWHPEGDVFVHTGLCLDALVALPAWQAADPAERRLLTFAVLAHDFGKAETTVRAERRGVARWTSPGHDRAGGPLAEAFLERIGSPLDLRPMVRRLVESHHVHQSWPLEGPSAAAVRRLSRKLAPATIAQLVPVLEADHCGRPPLVSAETTRRIGRLAEAARALALERRPPRPLLTGRHLLELGLRPGPEFGRILGLAFEAQLDGAFSDLAGGRAWLKDHVPPPAAGPSPGRPEPGKFPMNTLEQLKQHTVVVADTGDFNSLKQYGPRDATTNPSLILKAAQMPEYAALIDKAVADNKASSLKREALLERIIDHVLILFGLEILKIVPGRVSTEVDARYSFDTGDTILVARELIAFYEKHGIDRDRVLIKIASTWEGIAAAEVLERDGIHCNLTLLFSLPQAVRCADAKVTLISPFVGRILDWFKAKHGRDYAGHEDPGVVSVKQIYDYYKKFGYKTEVMGASFRNTEEILELCGCDLLTISPDLLKKLQADTRPAPRKLTEEAAKASEIERLELDEKRFRYLLNDDAMATEKTAEGIRNFAADIVKLEKMIEKKLG